MTHDYYIIFDGGCVGNQRHGVYQITANDRARVERCKFGQGTRGEAEYLTLVTALGDIVSRCKQAKVPLERFTVGIKSSSQLVVNQVMGEWAVDNPELKVLYNRVYDHLKNFQSWHIELKSTEYVTQFLRY